MISQKQLRLADVIHSKNNRIVSKVSQVVLSDVLRNERSIALAEGNGGCSSQPVLIVIEPTNRNRFISEKGVLLTPNNQQWLYVYDKRDICFQKATNEVASLCQYRPNSFVKVRTGSRGKWCSARVIAQLYTARDEEVFYFLDNRKKRIMWNLKSLFPETKTKDSCLSISQRQKQPPVQLTDILNCINSDEACFTHAEASGEGTCGN